MLLGLLGSLSFMKFFGRAQLFPFLLSRLNWVPPCKVFQASPSQKLPSQGLRGLRGCCPKIARQTPSLPFWALRKAQGCPTDTFLNLEPSNSPRTGPKCFNKKCHAMFFQGTLFGWLEKPLFPFFFPPRRGGGAISQKNDEPPISANPNGTPSAARQ